MPQQDLTECRLLCYAGAMAVTLARTTPTPSPQHGSKSIADTIVNSMHLPLLVVDGNRNIRFVNEAAEAFFGSSKTRMLGTPLASLFATDSRLATLLDKAATSQISISDHAMELDGDPPRLVNLHITPLHDPSPPDTPSHDMLLMFEEGVLGERLRVQAPQQEAGRRLSVFAAMLAHEIKTPLAAIRGASELLGGDTTNTRDLTRLIIGETDRITALINRMESLADGSPMHMHPINIHEIIDHCLAIATSSFATHHTIHRQFDPSLPETLGDRDWLIQAFINLIKNACEAADKASEITIATLYNTGPRLALANSTGNANPAKPNPTSIATPTPTPTLSVVVKNYGTGIDPSLGDRIFDLFTTTKANGNGLGLALVARVAAGHHGAVEARHESDGATAFYFTLPITGDRGDRA